ncbi:sensor histidine kinase [Mycetocola zhadangensis]|uniref:histidine kinase n=1 Tax=Mycetocola zhadangensis TaxID=1164595 RepID=A0A3L7IX51_9MICO|nr:HAMP domain-containing sensor histidine kinase [Mycetocola zhadangensis]RLQ82750.1 sensor histidine kinase [Mycetocola zhadangensis]GGE98520.1 two-component sensor histidine kinase [Mycetocola zhadangensis]
MSPRRSAELGSPWLGFHPGVVIQVADVLIVAGCVLLALLIDPAVLATPAFAVAITILGIATVFAFLLGRTDSDLLYLVPVLDMLALIVMRQVPDQHIHAIGFLAILPALWLGWSGRPSLAALAVVLSLGLVEIPGVNDHSALTLELALRDFLTPTVVLVAAASTCVAARRTNASIRSLVEQEKTTAASLEREKSTSQLLDRILDTVDTGILSYDANGTQILANRTVQKHPVIEISGLTPLELEQQGYMLEADRVTPVLANDGLISRALRGDEYSNRIIWITVPGAPQHALSVSARPVLGPDRAFAGTVIAIDDVTAYLEAISAKDSFVSSISHEFRTPLASIVGYLELTLDDPAVTDGTRESLEVIERNANRLQQLVSDLLAEAGRERGAVKLERELADVSVLCAEVVERCATAARAAGVHLTVEADEPAMAVIDQRRIAQAVNNLISNALKFSPPGGTATVTVDTDSEWVRIVVQDSGTGVPVDEMKALASPFYRPTQAGEQFPGVGLALVVIKGLIEAHRGTLSFSTTPGPGTTVTVLLPVR